MEKWLDDNWKWSQRPSVKIKAAQQKPTSGEVAAAIGGPEQQGAAGKQRGPEQKPPMMPNIVSEGTPQQQQQQPFSEVQAAAAAAAALPSSRATRAEAKIKRLEPDIGKQQKLAQAAAQERERAAREGAGAQRVGMAGTYQAISEMGAVEVLEPHDRAYFTAYIIDIEEGGKKTLVRSLMHADVFARGPWIGRTGGCGSAAGRRAQCGHALAPVSAGSAGTRGSRGCADASRGPGIKMRQTRRGWTQRGCGPVRRQGRCKKWQRTTLQRVSTWRCSSKRSRRAGGRERCGQRRASSSRLRSPTRATG